MLQIDHVYEFLYTTIFKDFTIFTLPNGVLPTVIKDEVNKDDFYIFNYKTTDLKIFLWDQEPVLHNMIEPYIKTFRNDFPDRLSAALVTSERSPLVVSLAEKNNINSLYYFFHGFAALDWYRGHFALNYNKPIVRHYNHNFISYNRIINHDRSYRIYFISKLQEHNLLCQGLLSFGVTNDNVSWQDEIANPESKLSNNAKYHAERHLTTVNKLVIDYHSIHGSASADIPRTSYHLDVDALWNIVTETVFYYDKLHLTEKIFKPIVSKQPFMLLAAPGNLAYLRSYGFKTFDGIIDESYDLIQDNDSRIDAVVEQIQWYCNLTAEEKQQVIERLAPIVEYNFHHFYGEFKHIITRELLDNCKTLFKKIGYDDQSIAYEDIYKVLTS